MVDNKPIYSITYTPPKGVQAKDRLEVAKDLSKYIKMYDDKEDKKKKFKTITDRDLKEYWFLLGKNEEKVIKRLSKKRKRIR